VLRHRHHPKVLPDREAAERKAVTKLLPSKEKPSNGWGLAACLLVLIAVVVSMCETVTNKIETEEIKMENRP
jgi:hypothetical protein